MSHTPSYLPKPGKFERRVRHQKSARHHDRKYRESAYRLGLYGQSSNPQSQERNPMYGLPNVSYPSPRDSQATPPMIVHFGRPWLSSVGLAELLGRPHSAVFDHMLDLKLPTHFWDMHFTEFGKRSVPTVIWMDHEGFLAVTLGIPNTGWRDVIEAGFTALTPPPPPEPCISWHHRLARMVLGGWA